MDALLQVNYADQNNMLALFEKRAIVELSPDEMMGIDGGTTPVCLIALTSSEGCAVTIFMGITIIVSN